MKGEGALRGRADSVGFLVQIGSEKWGCRRLRVSARTGPMRRSARTTVMCAEENLEVQTDGSKRRGRPRKKKVVEENSPADATAEGSAEGVGDNVEQELTEEKPKARRRRRTKKEIEASLAEDVDFDAAAPASELEELTAAPKIKRGRGKKAGNGTDADVKADTTEEAEVGISSSDSPTKRGRKKAQAPIDAVDATDVSGAADGDDQRFREFLSDTNGGDPGAEEGGARDLITDVLLGSLGDAADDEDRKFAEFLMSGGAEDEEDAELWEELEDLAELEEEASPRNRSGKAPTSATDSKVGAKARGGKPGPSRRTAPSREALWAEDEGAEAGSSDLFSEPDPDEDLSLFTELGLDDGDDSVDNINEEDEEDMSYVEGYSADRRAFSSNLEDDEEEEDEILDDDSGNLDDESPAAVDEVDEREKDADDDDEDFDEDALDEAEEALMSLFELSPIALDDDAEASGGLDDVDDDVDEDEEVDEVDEVDDVDVDDGDANAVGEDDDENSSPSIKKRTGVVRGDADDKRLTLDDAGNGSHDEGTADVVTTGARKKAVKAAELEPEKPAPKKRGRKPKAKSPAAESLIDDDDLFDDLDEDQAMKSLEDYNENVSDEIDDYIKDITSQRGAVARTLDVNDDEDITTLDDPEGKVDPRDIGADKNMAMPLSGMTVAEAVRRGEIREGSTDWFARRMYEKSLTVVQESQVDWIRWVNGKAGPPKEIEEILVERFPPPQLGPVITEPMMMESLPDFDDDDDDADHVLDEALVDGIEDLEIEDSLPGPVSEMA